MCESSGLRVILIGATGLDARLRFASDIELSRVGSPMEAIGELGDPIDRESPVRCVVVMRPEAVEEGERDELARALRRVDPAVRILIAGQNGHAEDGPSENGVFDGRIDPASSEEELRRGLAGPGPAEDASRAKDAPDREHRFELDGRSEAEDGADERQSASPVEAMLRGRDVLPAALREIAERLGVESVGFGGAGPSADRGEVVRWRDRAFGVLSVPAGGCVDGEDLRREAARLGAWLRLDEQQAELRRAALTDPLTGAWNRRYFDRFLPFAIDRAKRRRGTLTVLAFDIDDFKRFNTEFGHSAGDEILIEMVHLLRSVIRPTDRVCRMGGDEFCVVFDEPDGPREPGSRPPESVYEISRRFQTQIGRHRFPKLGAQAPGELSISGGLATYPWDGRDACELLERADELALRSKAQGKNAILMGPGAERLCGGTSDDRSAEGPDGRIER